MPSPFPVVPEVPPAQRGNAHSPLRYEDVSQDGRVLLLSLPHAMGLAVWQTLMTDSPVPRAAQQQGLVPLLTRLVIEGAGGPVSVRRPLEIGGGYALGHTTDAAGEPNRIRLDTWAEVKAPRARTHGPPPEGAGEVHTVGRIYGEHVFTRPFAATPDGRKVRRLELEGVPAVPPLRFAFRAGDEVLAPPADATGLQDLDGGFREDGVPVVFGLMHSDSNQHVNSLAYPRIFEEAALRRLGEHGKPTRLISRYAEVTYRKPCFAGERVRLFLRAFAAEGGFWVTGAFAAQDSGPESLARAHACVRLWLTA
jgi:hypothetical protein